MNIRQHGSWRLVFQPVTFVKTCRGGFVFPLISFLDFICANVMAGQREAGILASKFFGCGAADFRRAGTGSGRCCCDRRTCRYMMWACSWLHKDEQLRLASCARDITPFWARY